jgi:hypothetical protein
VLKGRRDRARRGDNLLGLLKQLRPRGPVIFGCAILALAGMTGLLAWLDTIPPWNQLRHVRGELHDIVLQSARTGAFKITLASGGKFYTFEFENAHRLVALLSQRDNSEARRIDPRATIAVAYYSFGRGMKVVDVTLGQDNVLSYKDVASLAAEKVVKDRNSAIGLGALGTFLIFLGGAARIAAGGSQYAAPNADTTMGVLCWLTLYGLAVVVILTEPAILHSAFGARAFMLPIEYVLPMALALLFLPLWPGCMGLSTLMRQATRKGIGGKLGLIIEMRSLLASRNPKERRTAIEVIWFFAYFILLCTAWIAYAALLGI